jgi:ankyrin repeat protein
LEIIKLLLRHGADINIKYYCSYALHYAYDETNGCKRVNLAIIDLLIQYGASVNAQDDRGTTPLHVACYNNDISIMRHLISLGADIDAGDDQLDGFTYIT